MTLPEDEPYLAFRACLWLDAARRGVTPWDDALAHLPSDVGWTLSAEEGAGGSAPIEQADGWMGLATFLGRMGVDHLALRLPIPGDVRGAPTIVFDRHQRPAAIALLRRGACVAWIQPLSAHEWLFAAPSDSGSRLDITDAAEADRRLRSAILEALKELQAWDLSDRDPGTRDAVERRIDHWRRMPWPPVESSERADCFRRALPLALGLPWLGDHVSVTSHDATVRARILADVARAACIALEASASGAPSG